MNVLLVGSGGREHALAWKLRQSTQISELHAAPGNPGIAPLGHCHPVRAEDGESLLGLAGEIGADLVVIGPEGPLVAGVADQLRRAGLRVFGPGADAARIEGSKTFAKDVMAAAAVPTARTMSIARPPCVIKADGLAAGKGVVVCRDESELETGLRAAAGFDGRIVIEEFLEGEEVSVFALSDGAGVMPLPAAKDYSRAGEGDTGPNTGGMGSFSPVPGLEASKIEELVDSIHRPVVTELARRGTPFVGALYAGVMLTDEGPRVLEFNCRFGDPETQTIFPLVDGDLLGALTAVADGDLSTVSLGTSPGAAVTVVLTAGGYPASGDVGTAIEGIEQAEAAGVLVFHAGTALRNGRVVTNGGRILNMTALADTIEEARQRAYEAAELVSFDGVRFRRDIAAEAVSREHA